MVQTFKAKGSGRILVNVSGVMPQQLPGLLYPARHWCDHRCLHTTPVGFERRIMATIGDCYGRVRDGKLCMDLLVQMFEVV